MGPTFKEMGTAQSVQSALEPLFEPGFASRCQVGTAYQLDHHIDKQQQLQAPLSILIPGCDGNHGKIACLQVHSTLISSEDAGDSEVLAINAAAAALSNSDIPWSGENIFAPPLRKSCMHAEQARCAFCRDCAGFEGRSGLQSDCI